MTATLTRDAEHRVVSQLAKGFNVDVVATRTHQPKDVVRRLAERHGYPDLGALGRAAQELAISLRADAVTSGLLDRAREVPELGHLVGAVDEAIAQLRAAFTAHLEREKLAAELEALEVEIAAREKRAKVLRAQLKPPAAAVRAWARANDIKCPTRGTRPFQVLEAYAKAHGRG